MDDPIHEILEQLATTSGDLNLNELSSVDELNYVWNPIRDLLFSTSDNSTRDTLDTLKWQAIRDAVNEVIKRLATMDDLDGYRRVTAEIDCSMLDSSGLQALRVAIGHGSLNVARHITEKSDELPLWGHLHEAAANSLKVLRYFVERKRQLQLNFDVDEPFGWSQKTLFHSACQAGNVQVAQYLVQECHANTMMKTTSGYSPLHFACLSNNLDTVKYVVERCGGTAFVRSRHGGGYSTPLHIAVMDCRSVEIARYLGQHGANANDEDNAERTPLHLACQYGPLEMVQCLVKELGGNVDKASRWGWTALSYACYSCKVDVLHYLVEECGADVKVRDTKHRTLTIRPNRFRPVEQYQSDHFPQVVEYLQSVNFTLTVPFQDGGRFEPSVRLNPLLCDRHCLLAAKVLHMMTEVMGMDSMIAYHVMGYLSPLHVSQLG